MRKDDEKSLRESFRLFPLSEKQILELRDEITTGLDAAFEQLDEAGLSRILSRLDDNSVWSILTAYRNKYDKKTNVLRNRDLRAELNAEKLGPYPLVGHWQECQVEDEQGNPIPWDKCPKDQLVHSIERSYLVIMREGYDADRFEDLLFRLGAKYNQDSIVFVGNGKQGVYDSRTQQEYVRFDSSNPRLGEIAQAYSQYVRKMNVPFMFEGIEVPNAVSYGLKAFREMGFHWP